MTRRRQPEDFGVFWAVVNRHEANPMPCLVSRRRESARELRDPDERVVRVRVVEVRPGRRRR